MNIKQFVILALAMSIVGATIGVSTALADSPNVCDQSLEHRESPLENLGDGTYCVKGGSANSNCVGYLVTGSYEDAEVAVNQGGACGLSHWTFDPAVEPDPTDTDVPEPTATPVLPDDTPDPEPTEVVPEPTILPPTLKVETPEPTPTHVPPDCVPEYTEVGELFLLVGPDGQTAWFGSYQRNPNTGAWALPNSASQQKCLGWVAVDAPDGKIIYRNSCTGEYSITTTRCEGGASCPGAYSDE